MNTFYSLTGATNNSKELRNIHRLKFAAPTGACGSGPGPLSWFIFVKLGGVGLQPLRPGQQHSLSPLDHEQCPTDHGLPLVLWSVSALRQVGSNAEP